MKELLNLKEMLNNSIATYSDEIAYKIKIDDNCYKTITYSELGEKVNSLGTSLINLGLKDKKIAVVGENRLEWEIAYLSVVCGTRTCCTIR